MALQPMARPAPVNVRVGSVRRANATTDQSSVCIVGIAPPDATWLSEAYPDALVKEARLPSTGEAVEHIRFTAVNDAWHLPGLTGSEPSRVRDAVKLALATGAPAVDVVLARAPEAKPWDLQRWDVIGLLNGMLDNLPGSILVFPDMGGPFPVGPTPSDEPTARLMRMIIAARRMAPSWVERFQIALADVLMDASPDDRLQGALRLISTDIGLCRWLGSEARLREHGWRCGAAAVAGLLSMTGASEGVGIVGRTARLSAGRDSVTGRHDLLRLREIPFPEEPLSENYIDLQLHRVRDEAVVRTDGCFRRPLGEWSLPSLRTVKAVHRRLVDVAETFVFKSADGAQALALEVALQDGLEPFVDQGLLVGPGGSGPPLIRGGVERIPGQPSLTAQLTAQLRPWSQRVQVRVALSPDNKPSLEVR